MAFAQVMDVQFLGKRQRARLAVAGNLDPKDPLQIVLILDWETFAQIRYKALAQALVIVHNDSVVHPHEQP